MLNLGEGQYFGEHLKAADNGFFKLSLTSYGSDSIIEKHYHDNDYLSILTNGSYLEKCNNETFQVRPGDILFRPSAYSHQNQFENVRGACFNIEFKADWKKSLDVNLKLPDRYTHYGVAGFPALYKLLINFKHDHNEDLATEFIYDWLFTINRHPGRRSGQPWVENVIRILENELDVFHSLAELAERACVHPVYLARAFKERTGLTIGEYQLKCKLNNAVELLLNTSRPISHVSYANGFYDDAHFIRSFRSVYGFSPLQFRHKVKS